MDVDELRRRFPAFAREVGGRPAVYMDGPAGTQVPEQVIEAVSGAMVRAVSNVGGPFPASHDSEAVVAAARSAAAHLVGGRPDEIAFGPNMTTLTFGFSRALSRDWGPGDGVVLTRLEHDANITPWVMAAADRGARVVFCDILEDATLDLDHLESLVDERTKLVAVTGCSNAFGTLVDLPRVAAAAHSVGAVCFVDAVHLAPHVRIDVARLGVDVLVCSAYKLFGPHVGVLWGRRSLLDAVRPYRLRPAPAEAPGKFETGTPSFPLLAGLTAAIEYLASIGVGEARPERLDDAYRRIGAHEAGLGERFLAGLPEGVRVVGRDAMAGRVPTFALDVAGLPAAEAAARLGEQGIFVWAGHYYAVEPMERLGVLDRGGLVRIGFVHTTTAEEVDRVLEALAHLTRAVKT